MLANMRLLRRHVAGGAEDHAGLGHPDREGRRIFTLSGGTISQLGEAEIENLNRAVRLDLDVGRLQVAMDDAFLVRGFQSVADLPGEGQSFLDG
jgi:hypothetical protein